jgi:crotonobetaine/carnitine-CoA ligase
LFLDLAVRERMTHSLMVPAMYNLCLLQDSFATLDLSAWRVGAYGGAPMPVASIEALAATLPQLVLMNCYGATETTSPATMMPPGQTASHHDTVGLAVPCGEMRVMDDEGQPLAAGEMGEIWIRGIRGVTVCLEYLGNDEANEKFFTEDGWCRTGDIVQLTEGGNVVYRDRDKDALKVGGENVSAREVEDAIRQVPGLEDIAVVAKSHEMLDMVAVAFVILADKSADQDAVAAQIIDVCKANLADFKVPRAVYFVDEFPTAELGKISKKDLRELADTFPAV